MNHLLECAVLVLAIFGHAYAASEKKAALLIVDVQDCFLPGGSLPVTHGDAILPVINSIRKNNTFDLVVFSLDWHLSGHVSFASAHQKSAFDIVTLRYLENGTLCLGETVTARAFPRAVNCSGSATKTLRQTLYPDHCIQNVSSGPTSSQISDVLTRNNDDFIVHKGIMKQIDSYSAFFDNGKFFSTNLDDELKKRKIDMVFIVGFALDICVFHTSMDAKYLGYDTYTVTDASVGIDPQHVETAKKNLTATGIKLITHAAIQAILEDNASSGLPAPGLALMLALLLTSAKFVYS